MKESASLNYHRTRTSHAITYVGALMAAELNDFRSPQLSGAARSGAVTACLPAAPAAPAPLLGVLVGAEAALAGVLLARAADAGADVA
jgi:hypothetical protein